MSFSKTSVQSTDALVEATETAWVKYNSAQDQYTDQKSAIKDVSTAKSTLAPILSRLADIAEEGLYSQIALLELLTEQHVPISDNARRACNFDFGRPAVESLGDKLEGLRRSLPRPESTTRSVSSGNAKFRARANATSSSKPAKTPKGTSDGKNAAARHAYKTPTSLPQSGRHSNVDRSTEENTADASSPLTQQPGPKQRRAPSSKGPLRDTKSAASDATESEPRTRPSRSTRTTVATYDTVAAFAAYDLSGDDESPSAKRRVPGPSDATDGGDKTGPVKSSAPKRKRASSTVGAVSQPPSAKKSRTSAQEKSSSARNAPKAQHPQVVAEARSFRARRSQPGTLSELSLFDAAFSSAHTEDHAIPAAVDDDSSDSAEAYADPDGDAPSDASSSEFPRYSGDESDTESSWSGIPDKPAEEDEPAPGIRVVKVPNEDKIRIQEYLAAQGVPLDDDASPAKATANKDSAVENEDPVDETQQILDLLEYRTEFTNWRTVLLDLAALSLAESRVANLEAFMDTLVTRPPSLTPNPVGSFRNRPGDDWINDDDEITEEWDTSLCPDIEALAGPELDIRTLSKPSGRRDATLSLVLYYPTFNTGRLRGGSTFDPSNPCLNMIKTKIGPSQAVKVQDRIMARHEYEKQVDWSRAFPNWAEMAERFLSFNRFLNEDSPILILMGNENCRRDNLGDLIRLGQDDEICWIRFAVAVKLFGDGPSFALVRNKTTRAIKRVVFLSWHPHRFFHDGTKVYGAYHDLIFNACCELAGIDSVNKGYFTWKLKKCDQPLNLVNSLRCHEKQRGLLDEGLVRTLFSNLIRDNPELFGSHVLPRSATGSYVGGVITTLNKNLPLAGVKGHATQAAAGYPGLAKGRATMAAAGHPGLAKGRAMMVAAGHPGLAKGRAVMAAAGHPGLAKGRATQAAAGHPELVKGRARIVDGPIRDARSKRDALLKMKQVQDLLANVAATGPEIRRRELLKRFAESDMVEKKCRASFNAFLNRWIVLWTPDSPEGLRWEGDGSPDEDRFDYSKPHPAHREVIKLGAALKGKKKGD